MSQGTPKVIDLDEAIGRQIRAIRETAGVPRELLVVAAQQAGIPWSVATLALVEDGRRRLTTGELFLLPAVLTVALKDHYPKDTLGERRPFEIRDLIPEDQHLVVTPDCHAYGVGLRHLIAAGGVRTDAFEARDAALFTLRRDPLAPVHDEATRRAAAVLHLPIKTVAEVSQRLWGNTFLDERDRRVPERLPQGAAGKYLRALRGHVARELMQEVRADLKYQRKARASGRAQ